MYRFLRGKSYHAQEMRNQRGHAIAFCLIAGAIAVVFSDCASPKKMDQIDIIQPCERIFSKEMRYRIAMRACSDLMETSFYSRDEQWHQLRDELLSEYDTLVKE